MNSPGKILLTIALSLSITAVAVAQQSSVTAGTNVSTTGKLDVDVVTGNADAAAFRVFNSARR